MGIEYSVEFQAALEKWEQEFPALQKMIEDDPDNPELLKRAEDLSRETGFTFWFVRDVLVDHSDYGWDTTKWNLFIPEKIDQWDPDMMWKANLRSPNVRSFIFGESAGHEREDWISSYSC